MVLSILFLGTQMSVGGAQRVLFTQAHWFHRRGNKVVVACFYDKEGLHERWRSEAPFPVVNLDGWRKGGNLVNNGYRLMGGMFRLLMLMLRSRFDVVETFTPHSNLLGIPLAWLAGIRRRIATHHGRIQGVPGWVDRFHGWLVNSGLASCLVAVSPQVQQLAVEVEGVHPGQVIVIPNGVELPDPGGPIRANRLQTRQVFGVGPEALLVLTVGRLTEEKGHRYLLAAVPAVLERFPEAYFLVVGDGPQWDALHHQAEELGIMGEVSFTGTRHDLDDLYLAADVFVLPSISEGMPMVLLEAMGRGLPVIASGLGGIRAVVTDEENGLLVPPAEVESLGLALNRLLADNALREQLGRNAEALVREEFTIDKMCERYERVFQLE